MFHSEPVQLRLQRAVLGPLAFLILGLAGLGVFWLQQARHAGAAPVSVYRSFEGNATVKVKNGNAWATYKMDVCATVETAGANGPILNAYLTGNGSSDSDSDNESNCDMLDVLVLENAVQLATPGSFSLDTLARAANNAGKGWKPPVQLTSQSASFGLQGPLADAATVYLNNSDRLLQGGGNLTVKFYRNRGGLYFKATGFVPLNDNGNPKVAIEIESNTAGLDAPPEFVSSTPADSDSDVDSDSSVAVTFSEPVNVAVPGVSLTCTLSGDVQFMLTGNGTAIITINPDVDLIFGETCTLDISAQSVDDVDTVDPPVFGPQSGVNITFTVIDPNF